MYLKQYDKLYQHQKKFELILHKYIFVVPLPTLMVSEFMHELGFTGIRCKSGTVPAAVSPYATVCLLLS